MLALIEEDPGEAGYAAVELPEPRPPRCQWIAGEPSFDDDCKCPADAIPGRPYCEEHALRAYVQHSALDRLGRREESTEFRLPQPEACAKARLASLPKARRAADAARSVPKAPRRLPSGIAREMARDEALIRKGAARRLRPARADTKRAEPRRFTPEQDETILRMRAASVPYRTIAARIESMGTAWSIASVRARWQKLTKGAV